MEDKKLLTWLIIATLLVSVTFGFMTLNKEIVVEVPELPPIEIPPITATLSPQDKADIVAGVVASIPAPVAAVDDAGEPVDLSPGSFVLNKEEFEEEAIEAMAEEMALVELDSRDFKKAVFAALEAEGVDIEDYKDITDFKIMDVDVDENEVTLDVKVSYILDGDEDETEKARLEEFVITVDDLDFDDDFEDAEVDEGYLDDLVIRKVYD